MNIIAYAVRPDEIDAINKYATLLNLHVEVVSEPLSATTVDNAKGFDGVIFLGLCDVNRSVLSSLNQMGIKYIASRSAGYNNVDMKAADEFGIKVSNATYSPHCVADFAVMMILMSIRKLKPMMKRNDAHDYALEGLQGKEMKNLTIGVLGTGRIGAQTAHNLSGFGCKILGYDIFPNNDLYSILTYVDLETFMRECDVITIHAPLLHSTKHIINRDSLSLTKPGVVIVNCARAELIDTDALIEFIESGHIGAAALDVFPDEVGIIHKDNRMNLVNNHRLSILNSHHNVLITPHAAFYTDQAVSDMVEVSLRSIKSFLETGTSHWEVRP
ncbi:lactate dehydrogenase [Erysipelothrix larvae]|uniref:Lactate dehydrogenase n=1 Tax=Erysipelothrix larvae TaxID=1514105 RepID=A0A0X8GY22_9FIRM|nr:D-isomer specific 2-hydroxyacid dehydrogenase family protein [Erysipelothrix larvae]AMC92526.1 lactate dehydrogenase [Erysipelothrix larvae]